MKFIPTSTYERAVRKLLPRDERRAMERAIATDPSAAPVIPGTGGIRKLRWALPGRASEAERGRSIFTTPHLESFTY